MTKKRHFSIFFKAFVKNNKKNNKKKQKVQSLRWICILLLISKGEMESSNNFIPDYVDKE